jgi:hypothetical protein
MAARDLNHITWRKSSYTAGNNCVEIGWTAPTGVAVRDSKQPAGPTLSFPATTWHAFLTSKNTLD